MTTAIIILNYNGGEDTINCLKSLQNCLTIDDFIFVVDNGSNDYSSEIIIDYIKSNNTNYIKSTEDNLKNDFDKSTRFYFIQNKENKGFGGGNNTVLNQLKYINFDFKYTWFLNNDLIINENTLINLKKTISQDENIGCVGSIIMNLPDNNKIQSTGANYNKYLGISKLINKNISYQNLIKKTETIQYDYLSGASLLFNNKILNEIGFFDEIFFLYSEEFDLQIRLKKQKYTIKLCQDSIVYHKLSSGTSKQKHLFYFYYNMSILLLSKKHYSVFHTLSIIVMLPMITLSRSFPSLKNFYWGMKGIIKGIFN